MTSRVNAIDINCDAGEHQAAIEDGSQERILRHVTSVNIACGGHAGDEHTMRATVEQARRLHLAVGAHPGYSDRANFGRAALDLTPEEVATAVFEQLRALAAFTGIAHVKPHGALYNQAARDATLTRAIADGVARFSRDVVMVGLAGSVMLDVFADAGFATAAEAFADRRYEPDGTLRPRRFNDALLSNPADAAEQAVRLATDGRAQTICIHSDTPDAAAIAEAVNNALVLAGFAVRPLAPRRH
jgi:UPF0271 protein